MTFKYVDYFLGKDVTSIYALYVGKSVEYIGIAHKLLMRDLIDKFPNNTSYDDTLLVLFIHKYSSKVAQMMAKQVIEGYSHPVLTLKPKIKDMVSWIMRYFSEDVIDEVQDIFNSYNNPSEIIWNNLDFCESDLYGKILTKLDYSSSYA